MKLPVTFALIAIFATSLYSRGNDMPRPEGWAVCSSVNSGDDYALTGGGDGSLIVLRSSGKDMRQAIYDAVMSHDVIVFDGIDGDFEMSSSVSFTSISGKSFIGVNGAHFYTRFTVTKDICDLLDELNVKSLSQNAGDNLGGTLSNGSYVAEQCELTIRQALIDYFDDQKEPYRYSGVFDFVGCSDIILSNLDFTGPGSIDVGGADLVTLNGCNHIWVDHCRFTDGMDGNLDIVNNSDFVTVSDTHFRYTSRSYNHPLSNLNSGAERIDGSPQTNNISWFRCFWDEGCLGRMPYTVLGVHHLLNCYWDCTGGTCIDAHNLSKVLIESSYFTSKVRTALALRDDNVKFEWRNSTWEGKVMTAGNAKINVPYSYTAADVATVPSDMRATVGPALGYSYSKPLSATPAVMDFGTVYAGTQLEGVFNISAFGGDVPASVTITAPTGVLLSSSRDGEYSSTLVVEATDKVLIQTDIYMKACFSGTGSETLPIEVTAAGQSFTIPVKADVVGLQGERLAATLVWPLDKGTSSETEAVTEHPEAFSEASMTLGDNICFHSGHMVGDAGMLTLFHPTEAIGKAVDEDSYLEFDVVTAPGYVFVPEKLTFKASRIGTDMGYIDIEYSRDGGAPVKPVTGFQPERGAKFSVVELPLGNAGVGNSLRVKLYIYNLSANKQLAFGDVRIEGGLYAAESALDIIAPDENSEPTEYYDLLGRRVENPRSGMLYIERKGATGARVVKY
ncbi:MAG: hypothetical protein K2L14_08830 [Duncaniella sp.]|nr:hypothetical protein [Duncaniella sp.]